MYEYTNNTLIHRGRVHVQPFDPASFAYVPTVGGGTEVHPMDTFAALAGHLKHLYTSAWSFRLVGVYHNVSGTMTELFGWSDPGPVVGDGTATSNPRLDECGVIFNYKSTGGGRARISLWSPSVAGAGLTPYTINHSSSANVWDTGLLSYLIAADTAVCARDSNPIIDFCHVTFPVSSRLRRKYGHT